MLNFSGARGQPGAHTPAPKAAATFCGSAGFICLISACSATAPAWFSGCGRSGTGFPDCSGPRIWPNHLCGPERGPRRSPGSASLSGHTPGRTAQLTAARAEGHPSIPAGYTSHASQLTRAGRPVWACVPDTSRPGSAARIRGGGRVGAASWPRAITSGQTKSPHRQPSLSGLVIGTGCWSTGHDRY